MLLVLQIEIILSPYFLCLKVDVKSNEAPKEDNKYLDEIKQLKDEVNEKNKVIKNLQQRLNDMKKTLQKELKFQSLPNEKPKNEQYTNSQGANEQDLINDLDMNSPIKKPMNPKFSLDYSSDTQAQSILKHVPPSTQFKKQLTNTNSANSSVLNSTAFNSSNKKVNLVNSQLSHLHDDVNFKYLKHVVLKFLTSREYEVGFSFVLFS